MEAVAWSSKNGLLIYGAGTALPATVIDNAIRRPREKRSQHVPGYRTVGSISRRNPNGCTRRYFSSRSAEGCTPPVFLRRTPQLFIEKVLDQYEVDFQFNIGSRPIFLFGVKDDDKARLATISCLEFSGRASRSMA